MTTPDSGFLPFAMLNGVVLPTDAIRISPLGSGFMFGEGVFETVSVQNAQPRLLRAHHERLSHSMRFLEASPLTFFDEFRNRCEQVIAKNSLVSGSLKIVVFKEPTQWSELIFARAPTYSAAHYERGFCVRTAPCEERIDSLHTLKSLNYLRNIREKRRAIAAGFDETLFVDPQLHVLECATTNVFVVKNGLVRTPPLNSHILPGVMRAQVLRMLGPQVGFEREITVGELLQADEVFLTNALIGIMPVARVDQTDFSLAETSFARSLMIELRETHLEL